MGFMNEIAVGVEALTEQQVLAVARHDARVRLSDEACKAIVASRDVIEALAGDPEPHYGISTGFGALATKHIAPDDRAALQRSLIRSHAAGSGPEVEREVVRALMLLRLSTLATGRTGVRLETARDLRGDAQRGHHAGGARVRLAGLLGRPRPAGALRARRDGRGHGPRRRGRADGARRRRARRGRHHAARAAREGGPGADQRRRRHARHADARHPRPARCCSARPTSPPR